MGAGKVRTDGGVLGGEDGQRKDTQTVFPHGVFRSAVSVHDYADRAGDMGAAHFAERETRLYCQPVRTAAGMAALQLLGRVRRAVGQRHGQKRVAHRGAAAQAVLQCARILACVYDRDHAVALCDGLRRGKVPVPVRQDLIRDGHRYDDSAHCRQPAVHAAADERHRVL